MNNQIELNNYNLIIFREDVLDCFYSIVKTIEEEHIETNIDYHSILKSLLKDFKLYNIIIFINELTNDIEFKKYNNSYKISLDYCEEIYSRIENLDTDKIKYKKKID
jgi:hypothetical protein